MDIDSAELFSKAFIFLFFYLHLCYHNSTYRILLSFFCNCCGQKCLISLCLFSKSLSRYVKSLHLCKLFCIDIHRMAVHTWRRALFLFLYFFFYTALFLPKLDSFLLVDWCKSDLILPTQWAEEIVPSWSPSCWRWLWICQDSNP